jgi:RNA polymerase sigma-70 factor (ECF subfamily)
MMLPSTHASLLFALQRADHREEAWAGFHARYRDVILGWCRRQGFRPDAAEDLTQDVLLKLFRELPRHTHDPARGRFRSWLKAVVHNALADFRRRRQNHPNPSAVGGTAFLERVARLEAPESVEDLTDTIERHAGRTAAEVFARVRARLEETTWQAFYQRMVEQRPAADVAAALGLSVGAVYKYTLRVKEMVIREYTDGRPAS